MSVITPYYYEEVSVREVYARVKAVFETDTRFNYEHIFIDYASQDDTLAILKEIAAWDACVKVMANARNFGHLRSRMLERISQDYLRMPDY